MRILTRTLTLATAGKLATLALVACAASLVGGPGEPAPITATGSACTAAWPYAAGACMGGAERRARVITLGAAPGAR